MDYVIRPFEDRDYEVLTEIINAVYPEYPTSANELRLEDSKRDPKCIHGRFILESEGKAVATANYDQNIWQYNPHVFDLSIGVLPKYRRSGLGAALFDHLVDQLTSHNPTKLRSYTREDFGDSVSFLKSRGFSETMRNWESRLDLNIFDMEPYKTHMEKLNQAGIELKQLSQLPQSEERDRALHELDIRLGADVPSPDPFTPISFETYERTILNHAGMYEDAFIVAVDGDRFIGVSTLWKSEGNDDLYTGLTAVDRDYRRKGIAVAMKLKAIEVAKSDGYSLIKTWNEQNNRAMLSINEALGYAKQPPWISFEKPLENG